jgi:prepilin-type N-terminal cleavage/methylation domain-containing protein
MMKVKKRKKRAVTLIEIMIVILLIGLIGGALAFNMRGSMDKGRVFKSEQNAARVYDALMMAYAEGSFELSQHNNKAKIKEILGKSPLIKDPAKIIKDAWGEDLKIELKDDELQVYSEKAKTWADAHKVK